jgi:hypothetical protein
MKSKELLAEIRAHCKRTGESPYTFGKRVLGDQTFVWKLKNSNRQPFEATVKKVMAAVNRSKPEKLLEERKKTGGKR